MKKSNDNSDFFFLAVIFLIIFLLPCCAHAAEPFYFSYTVHGPSMQPTLKSGQGVWIDLLFPYEQLKPGDVVVFDRYGTLNIHRLIHYWPGRGWTTKGDHYNTRDSGLVTKDAYVGRMLPR